MKKEDKLVASVRTLRSAVRTKVREETLSEYDEAKKEGKYPWEGMWLTPEQITRAQEKLKKRDKVVLFELLGFFFILIFFVLPLFASLTVSLMPKQNGKDYRKISKGAVPRPPSSPDFKKTVSENPARTGPRTNAIRNNKYFIQVGAWKKLSYARKVREQLKVQFPGVFIENRNKMYRVRIPDISSEEQGSVILKEIKENFNFTALLVRKR
jgi:hypothetical protein